MNTLMHTSNELFNQLLADLSIESTTCKWSVAYIEAPELEMATDGETICLAYKDRCAEIIVHLGFKIIVNMFEQDTMFQTFTMVDKDAVQSRVMDLLGVTDEINRVPDCDAEFDMGQFEPAVVEPIHRPSIDPLDTLVALKFDSKRYSELDALDCLRACYQKLYPKLSQPLLLPPHMLFAFHTILNEITQREHEPSWRKDTPNTDIQ